MHLHPTHGDIASASGIPFVYNLKRSPTTFDGIFFGVKADSVVLR